MKKLIIGFSYAPNNLFSWIIRKGTNSKISHCFILLQPDQYSNLPKVIYQASGLAVNYQNPQNFQQLDTPLEYYEFSLTDFDIEKNILFRLNNVGKPYAIKEIVGFLWVLLLRKFGKKVKNPLSGGSTAFVCSDIAAAHLPENPELTDGTMTPEDLRRWCEKNGTRITINM